MKARQGILIGVVSSLLTLLVVFGLLAATGAALAQKGDPPAPAAAAAALRDPLLAPQAGASYYHVPGSVLTPMDSGTTVAYHDVGCVYATGGTERILNAPLDIPPASRILSFTVYYYDTSIGDLSGKLTRYNAAGTSSTDLASISSTGSDGYDSRSDSLDHVTDTFNYSYAVRVSFGSTSGSLRVCGVRVMYYAPYYGASFMPVVTKGATSP